MRENELKLIEKKIREFEKKIKTLNRLEKELDSLNTEGFETEVEAIRSKLKSPDKIPEIEKGIEDLKGKISKKTAEPVEIEVVPEVAPAPKNAYGVVIGIGKYKDEGIPALKYAKEDALEIY
ncbi:MAG: hypothetical protein KAT65_07100, partial [Methanophagales archaeon]|nr:hypothetical protein [Methanophagales archaeon]